MLKSYYEILNIQETASKAEIKARYKKLVKMYHPDLNPSFEAQAIFKEINKAAEILLDDEKRKKYDELRTPKTYFNQKTVNKPEFKENTPPIKNGDDIILNISINYHDAIFGTTRVVNIARSSVCPKCQGRKFANGYTCSYCNGLGEKTETKKIKVKIPPSIKNKTKLRLKGEGQPGLNGGKNGNLYIIVNIDEKKELEIKNDTVFYNAVISPYLAVLGGNLTVPTLWGTTTIKIPPLTKANQSFKLIDTGILNDKTSKKGEQIVKVIIDIPKNLTEEEKELYEKLKELDLKKNHVKSN